MMNKVLGCCSSGKLLNMGEGGRGGTPGISMCLDPCEALGAFMRRKIKIFLSRGSRAKVTGIICHREGLQVNRVIRIPAAYGVDPFSLLQATLLDKYSQAIPALDCLPSIYAVRN